MLRKLHSGWVGAWLTTCFCAQADELFRLSAKLLQSQQSNAPIRIALELQNVSGQPQPVAATTRYFEGRFYLRDATGKVHEYIQTNYFNLTVTSFWIPPRLQLEPAASYR